MYYTLLEANLHGPWVILVYPKTCWCDAYIYTRGNVDKSGFKLVDRPTPSWQMEKHQELTPCPGKWKPGQTPFHFTLYVSFKSDGEHAISGLFTFLPFLIFPWIWKASMKVIFFSLYIQRPHLWPQKWKRTLGVSKVSPGRDNATAPSREKRRDLESPSMLGKSQARWCENYICVGWIRKKGLSVEQPAWDHG